MEVYHHSRVLVESETMNMNKCEISSKPATDQERIAATDCHAQSEEAGTAEASQRQYRKCS